MSQIGANLQYALESGISLSMCPILHYPPTERQDCFEDFSSQTQGWREAIDEAESALASARSRALPALLAHDPSGALRDFRSILDEQTQLHADVVTITVHIDDPEGYIALMPNPGLVAYAGDSELYGAVAYRRLRAGLSRPTLQIPRARFKEPLKWGLVADLLEAGALHRPAHEMLDSDAGSQQTRTLSVPPYRPRTKALNIRFVKGHGHKPNGFRGETPSELELGYAATRSWPGFLPNYFKPFINRPYPLPPQDWGVTASAADQLSETALEDGFVLERNGEWSTPLPPGYDIVEPDTLVAKLDGSALQRRSPTENRCATPTFEVREGRLHLFAAADAPPLGRASVDRCLPWEHSLAKRYGLRAGGPFQLRSSGWWAPLPAGAEQDAVLLGDDRLCEDAVTVDGFIRVAPPEVSAAVINSTRFSLVRAVLSHLSPPFDRIEGHMWWAPLPDLTELSERPGSGPSPVFLFEDGRQSPLPHAPSAEIASLGRGRFVHWEGGLWFSTRDGADPNDGQSRFTILIATH